MMEQGTVKWFNPTKGYGFILRENGGEAFVHYSEILANGYRNLMEGERVEFEVVENGPKGARATQITVIG
jgi:CspA family cold shock protein